MLLHSSQASLARNMVPCQGFTPSRTSSGVELCLASGGGSMLELDHECGQTGWENMGVHAILK